MSAQAYLEPAPDEESPRKVTWTNLARRFPVGDEEFIAAVRDKMDENGIAHDFTLCANGDVILDILPVNAKTGSLSSMRKLRCKSTNVLLLGEDGDYYIHDVRNTYRGTYWNGMQALKIERMVLDSEEKGFYVDYQLTIPDNTLGMIQINLSCANTPTEKKDHLKIVYNGQKFEVNLGAIPTEDKSELNFSLTQKFPDEEGVIVEVISFPVVKAEMQLHEGNTVVTFDKVNRVLNLVIAGKHSLTIKMPEIELDSNNMPDAEKFLGVIAEQGVFPLFQMFLVNEPKVRYN